MTKEYYYYTSFPDGGCSFDDCKGRPVRVVAEMGKPTLNGTTFSADVDIVTLCARHAASYEPKGYVLADQTF